MLHVRGEGMYEEYTSELGQETSGVKMWRTHVSWLRK